MSRSKQRSMLFGLSLLTGWVVFILFLALGGLDGATPTCADDCQSGTYYMYPCTATNCDAMCLKTYHCQTGTCTSPYECTCDNSK